MNKDMKREIKFDYIFKNNKTGDIIHHKFSLNGLESGLYKDITGVCHDETWIATRQFTGIIDNKEKEIYEYDRVFDPHAPKDERELFTVKWDNEMARFILDGEGESEWDETDWQIYDNIYENNNNLF